MSVLVVVGGAGAALVVVVIIIVLIFAVNIINLTIILSFPWHQVSWVIVRVIKSVRSFSPSARSAMQAATEEKFGTKVDMGMRMMPEL